MVHVQRREVRKGADERQQVVTCRERDVRQSQRSDGRERGKRRRWWPQQRLPVQSGVVELDAHILRAGKCAQDGLPVCAELFAVGIEAPELDVFDILHESLSIRPLEPRDARQEALGGRAEQLRAMELALAWNAPRATDEGRIGEVGV